MEYRKRVVETSRPLSIKEICQKFERSSSLSKETPSISRPPLRPSPGVRSEPLSKRPAGKAPLDDNIVGNSRSAPQWSKGKTQHDVLIQNRQKEKQQIEKSVRSSASPVLKDSVANQYPPAVTKESSRNNLVSKTVQVFEGTSQPSPFLGQNPLGGGAPSLLKPKENSAYLARVKPLVEDPSNRLKAKPPLSQQPPPTKRASQPFLSTSPNIIRVEERRIQTAPAKPPRTFAHNRFLEKTVVREAGTPPAVYSLMMTKGTLQNPFVRSMSEDTHPPSYDPGQGYVGLRQNPVQTMACPLADQMDSNPAKQYGTLKRCFSEEHVYANPHEAAYLRKKTSPIYDQPVASQKTPWNPNLSQLHYLCTPLLGVSSRQARLQENYSQPNGRQQGVLQNQSKLNKSSSPNVNKQPVRDAINQSFGHLWRKLYSKNASDSSEQDPEDLTGDSGSEVSMKDVQERIIYVRSLRKKIIGNEVGFETDERLFDSLLISSLTPSRKDVLPKGRLIYRFPPDLHRDSYETTMIPHLSFPDSSTMKVSSSYKSEIFLIAVQDENGVKTYGYFLRLMGSRNFPSTSFLTLPVVVCLLSTQNAFPFYSKILMEIEKHLTLPESKFVDYIRAIYNAEVPVPGGILELPDYTEVNRKSHLSRPIDNRMVTSDMTFLLQLLDIDLLIEVVSSLLLERRILLVAENSSTLFRCTSAVLTLLYPLTWQHSVLPVLPDALLAQCCTSTPFLFGVSSNSIHKVMDIQKEKLLIVDLDQGSTIRSVGDEYTILPGRSLKALTFALNLAKNMTDPTEMLRDVIISESFVRLFVETLGHCDHFIVEQEEGKLLFQKESFTKFHSSRSVQMFLAWFSETQMFENFVEERIAGLKLVSTRKKLGSLPVLGIFDRRVQEYWTQSQGSTSLRENVRELGKKVKHFGEKLRSRKGF